MKKACLLLLLIGVTFANRSQAQIRLGIPLPFPFLVWSARSDGNRQHYRSGGYSPSYSRPPYYYDEGYHRRYYTDEKH